MPEYALCDIHKVPLTFHHVERINNCTVGMYKCPVCVQEYLDRIQIEPLYDEKGELFE